VAGSSADLPGKALFQLTFRRIHELPPADRSLLKPEATSSHEMRIPKSLAGALLLLVASFALLYRDVFIWLIDDWELKGDYSHGMAIIPIALYLAWERRHKIAALEIRPSNWGLVLIGGSLLLLAAGTLGAETFVARVSIVSLTVGAIVFLLGWEHLRQLAFPVAFLFLMIPIPYILANRVTIPLQFVASHFGESMLSAAGVPVLREGNLIVLPAVTLHVAEACSGIRSLMSLFTAGVLYGYFWESRPWVRVFLCAATVPIAIVANGLRVTGTGLTAHFYGTRAAEGFFHAFSGWLVFLAAAALLVVVHRAIQWMFLGRPAEPAECSA
jgi:exosortase